MVTGFELRVSYIGSDRYAKCILSNGPSYLLVSCYGP